MPIRFNTYKLIVYMGAMICASSIAQSVPSAISYQGRLSGSNGQGLTPGKYVLQFRIWNSASNSASGLVWSQQQTVPVTSNGVLHVILGAPGGFPVPGDQPMANDLALAFSDSRRYVGVSIASSNDVPVTSPVEILPRQQILASPYALVAQTALNVINGIPPGTVLPFVGGVPPVGFLICDGSPYDGLAYPALFAAIGTTWGAGTEPGKFNVPDFRGRALFGSGVGGVDMNGTNLNARLIGQMGGEEAHKLSIPEMPSHVHPTPSINPGTYPEGFSFQSPSSQPAPHPQWAVGGDLPHNTMPP